MSRWIIPVLVLPGTVLVFLPLLIFRLAHGTDLGAAVATPGSAAFWMALLCGIPGAWVSLWSMLMFFRFGDGTAAPWDPPQRLVVVGPYCYVRNPMLIGVIAMLIAESLLLQSWPIGVWAAVFMIANAVYFPLFEEPKLRARFGADYAEYCRHVRRWLPRLTPWTPSPSPRPRTET